MYKRGRSASCYGGSKYARKGSQYGRSIGAYTRRVSRTFPPASLRTRVPMRMTGPEVKSVDTPQTNTALASGTTAAFVCVNLPVQGAAFYNRVASRIRMRSLMIRAHIYASGNNLVALLIPTMARIMVVYDRQPNGALPTPADLLTAYGSSGSVTSTVFDNLNMNNKDRFTVLMDNQVLLPVVGVSGAPPTNTAFAAYVDPNQNAGVGGPQAVVNMNRFIKLKGLETHYKASTGAIGDIATGSLLLFFFSDDTNPAVTSAYAVSWSARLKFHD